MTISSQVFMYDRITMVGQGLRCLGSLGMVAQDAVFDVSKMIDFDGH